MDYTTYFSGVNKMIGAFPGTKSEAFSTISNIMIIEGQLKLLRELKPNDVTSNLSSVIMQLENKLTTQLYALTKGKRPEVLFIDLLTR